MRLFQRKLSQSASASGADASVRVEGGYQPDTIIAPAGMPLRITFRREEASPCSDRVVFPDFDVTADLPQGQDVTVELLPERAGEYGFECGMGMLRGRLVVTPAEHSEHSPA
jgi:plastocyanin domain-containing protein